MLFVGGAPPLHHVQQLLQSSCWLRDVKGRSSPKLLRAWVHGWAAGRLAMLQRTVAQPGLKQTALLP